MKNNVWEEQCGCGDISEIHEKLIEQIGIPEWMKLTCPFCKKPLPLRSIRSVGLKFNTRNFGDVVVEFICESCQLMDTLYFRQEVNVISDFVDLLVGNKKPNSLPVIEEEMYKSQRNNVLEITSSRGVKKMPMVKRGSCQSAIVVSSSVYTCEKCGHMEVVKDSISTDTDKVCPKCQNTMKLISVQSSAETE